MNKTFFALFIFLLSVKAIAQVGNIDSFFLQGATWVTQKTTVGPLVPDVREYRWSHTIEHDSIINGQNYHLVSGIDISTRLNSAISIVNIDYGILGGIRVDNRKVYFLMFDSVSTQNSFYHVAGPNWQQALNMRFQPGIEKIIYDFDITVGSTFDISTVLSMDSVLLPNNVYADRYMFSQTEPPYAWVEGIGSLKGPLTQGGFPTQKMICYHNPSMALSYPDGTSDCNQYYTGVKEITGNTQVASFYPNPFPGGTLQFKSAGTINSIAITDVSGKLCEYHQLSAGQAVINTSLAPGIYFLRVNHRDGNSEIHKLVHY